MTTSVSHRQNIIVDKMAMILLYRYRQLNDPKEIKVEGLCPKFGIYIGLHQGGSIAVGDPVYVNIEWTALFRTEKKTVI